MVFSEPIFVFVFLPAMLALYLLVPGLAAKNLLLVLGSIVFYAFGELHYTPLIAAMVVVNYAFSHWIHASPGSRWPLVAGVAVNLGILIVFKYLDFLAGTVNGLLAWLGIGVQLPLIGITLPLGISFLVFHSLSYLIDVRRGIFPPQSNLLGLALYILLFPQLIAGPIVRYGKIALQLVQREQRLADIAEGSRRFILGLAKKVLIANQLGSTVDGIYALPAADLSTSAAWMAAVLYTLQIYFDFSGYSDMAIGLARMFGFRFPENFDRPYTARSIREFWTRWHMTLSNWFRDYVYIPAGGNRAGAMRTYANLMLIFVLCGLWHGASWNYLVWGLLHGGVMIAERLLQGRVPSIPLLAHLYVGLFIIVSWVFFRVEDIGHAWAVVSAMAGFALGHVSAVQYVDQEVAFFFCVGLICLTPLPRRIDTMLQGAVPMRILNVAVMAGIFALTLIYLSVSTYNPFIYFRF